MLARTDLYTALFSETTKESEQYYRMYFDIDNENSLEDAYIDMRNLYSWFKTELNVKPTVYFSGKKGFAVYFYFKPRKFEEYQYTCRAIVDTIREILVMPSLDETVIGDTARISRIPFTKHMGSGAFCIPVFPEIKSWTLDGCINASRNFGWIPDIQIDVATGIEDWLKEHEEKGKAKKEELMAELGNGKDFGWNLDRLLNLAPKLIGGRRCLIYRVIIPKMWSEGDSYHEILTFVKSFVKASGSSVNGLERLVQRHLRYTQEGKSMLWSQEAFFAKEPWAWRVFNDTR